ncbi:MAG: AAA family ATPase [Alistipes sp.]
MCCGNCSKLGDRSDQDAPRARARPVVAQDGRSQALRQTIAINGESMLRQIISDAGKGCVVEHMLNTGHLLRAILDDRGSISSRILALYNVTGETAAPFLKDLPPNEDYYENMRFLSLLGDDEGEHPERLFSGVMRIGAPAGDKSKESMLDQFGVDLTRSAAEGKLDPVIGREAEIERVIQILGRRKKNNPVLIGEAGVGKSAIVEGWRCASFRRACPRAASQADFSLDVSSLVAGTKYRGQFEERINALLKELSGSDVILFIDEIHTIVGAGSTQGSLDTANILKPALARGELQCIGATTMNEYRENIETDSALERRFQKIVVEQPSAEQTLHMLHNIRSQYESHHCVRYTDEALSACVGLTRRYVTDRFFPDKAIDVMDEAGSRARAFDAQVPESLKLLEQEIEQAAGEKNRAIKMQNYELAATLRNREGALRLRLQEVEKQWRENMARSPIEVGETAIREVIASMTGIPLSRISGDEQARLLDMESIWATS